MTKPSICECGRNEEYHNYFGPCKKFTPQTPGFVKSDKLVFLDTQSHNQPTRQGNSFVGSAQHPDSPRGCFDTTDLEKEVKRITEDFKVPLGDYIKSLMTLGFNLGKEEFKAEVERIIDEGIKMSSTQAAMKSKDYWKGASDQREELKSRLGL